MTKLVFTAVPRGTDTEAECVNCKIKLFSGLNATSVHEGYTLTAEGYKCNACLKTPCTMKASVDNYSKTQRSLDHTISTVQNTNSSLKRAIRKLESLPYVKSKKKKHKTSLEKDEDLAKREERACKKEWMRHDEEGSEDYSLSKEEEVALLRELDSGKLKNVFFDQLFRRDATEEAGRYPDKKYVAQCFKSNPLLADLVVGFNIQAKPKQSGKVIDRFAAFLNNNKSFAVIG